MEDGEMLCSCGKPGFIVHNGQLKCPDCALDELHQMMQFEAQVTTAVSDFTAEMQLEGVRKGVKDLYMQVAPYLEDGQKTVTWAGRQVYAVGARQPVRELKMTEEQVLTMIGVAPSAEAAILRKYLLPKVKAGRGASAYVTLKEAAE